MRKLHRGEIWLVELAKPNKRRPVVIVTRDVLLDVLDTATVAAITSTIRSVSTEVVVGFDEGLKHDCVVNTTQLFTIKQNQLKTFVGVVPKSKMHRLCRALAVATGC